MSLRVLYTGGKYKLYSTCVYCFAKILGIFCVPSKKPFQKPFRLFGILFMCRPSILLLNTFPIFTCAIKPL